MPNHLPMDKAHSIHHLHSLGWSQRRIAEAVSVDRKSVRRHLQSANSKGTTPETEAPTAPDEADELSKGTTLKAEAPTAQAPEPASVTATSSWGSRSDCEPFRTQIIQALEQRLSAQRIYQDLVTEHGFLGSYWSVNRFVKGLQQRPELPFRRIEVAPGAEAQIDFGTGAPYFTADGKRRRCYVLRVVLSHSRKAYSEVVVRQTTECFIQALENAFQAFGGAPRTLVIDNLKAAVTKADWFDPELNPKIIDFCRHYGVVILPTKPYMPRHKGKVERGIAYVQDNALKGRTFESLVAENEFLAHWERTVADTRIHGTIKQHVGKLFLEHERSALLPLPPERFPFYHEASRIVSRDGHIEVAKSYYSVPPEYLGRKVWARWDQRTVRVLNERLESIALHARMEPGKFSTHDRHIASEKISAVERGSAYLLGKVQRIGPQAARWAESLVAARGVESARVLQGLLALSRKHSSEVIERACETAWLHQSTRLRVIRQLIERQADAQQATLEFIDEHPLIRPPQEYAQFVHQVIQGGI